MHDIGEGSLAKLGSTPHRFNIYHQPEFITSYLHILHRVNISLVRDVIEVLSSLR
jgi:hypothetical protein